MLFAFFFPPSAFEVAIIAGTGFFVLLPELHRGYCYARWIQSGNQWWLDRDEQWKPPRWLFAIAWILTWVIAAGLYLRH